MGKDEGRRTDGQANALLSGEKVEREMCIISASMCMVCGGQGRRIDRDNGVISGDVARCSKTLLRHGHQQNTKYSPFTFLLKVD